MRLAAHRKVPLPRSDLALRKKMTKAAHQFPSYLGSEAWAVWNSCNGVFTDTVRWTKTEADWLLDDDHKDAGGKVVPVVVFVEPEDRHWLREVYEKERAHLVPERQQDWEHMAREELELGGVPTNAIETIMESLKKLTDKRLFSFVATIAPPRQLTTQE